MKHTPGPWKAVELDEFTVAIKLDRHHTHECNHIADAHIMTGNLGETVPEALANARLIAAAPELLEALEGLVKQVQRDCSISSDPKYYDLFQKHQTAIEAINKAKGQ